MSVLFTSTLAAVASPLTAMLGTSQSTRGRSIGKRRSMAICQDNTHRFTHRSLYASQMSVPPSSALEVRVEAIGNHHGDILSAS